MVQRTKTSQRAIVSSRGARVKFLQQRESPPYSIAELVLSGAITNYGGSPNNSYWSMMAIPSNTDRHSPWFCPCISGSAEDWLPPRIVRLSMRVCSSPRWPGIQNFEQRSTIRTPLRSIVGNYVASKSSKFRNGDEVLSSRLIDQRLHFCKMARPGVWDLDRTTEVSSSRTSSKDVRLPGRFMSECQQG